MGADMRKEGISPELDELISEVVGMSLDCLADQGSMPVFLVVEDDQRNATCYELEDDDIDECLEGAREKLTEIARASGDAEQKLGRPVRYGIAYEGAVSTEGDAYQDALVVEFGESGWCSYSLFVYVEGKGTGEGFRWSEPAPAGELEPLL